MYIYVSLKTIFQWFNLCWNVCPAGVTFTRYIRAWREAFQPNWLLWFSLNPGFWRLAFCLLVSSFCLSVAFHLIPILTDTSCYMEMLLKVLSSLVLHWSLSFAWAILKIKLLSGSLWDCCGCCLCFKPAIWMQQKSVFASCIAFKWGQKTFFRVDAPINKT